MEIMEYYNYLIEEVCDPRTKDWFLVHSPVPIILILLFYCCLILVGPNYMQNRKPYRLETFIKLYNTFQIIVNAMIVYGTLTSGWLTNYSWGCQAINLSPTGEGYRMATMVWWTYMIKIIDLSETVVFILRKKNQQVSFLHVYHHITTALLAWMGAKWIPGGMLSSLILINCAVHVIMYTYYLMSTGSPLLRKLVEGIKRWITVIQMTQFCILLLHTAQSLRPSCDAPKVMSVLLLLDLFINFYLFYDFYKKNYIRKKRV